MDLNGLTLRCWQAVFILGAPGEESCLCLSQLLEDAYIFWLMAPSIFQVSNSRLSCSHTVPLVLTPLSPSSTLKGSSGLYEEQLQTNDVSLLLHCPLQLGGLDTQELLALILIAKLPFDIACYHLMTSRFCKWLRKTIYQLGAKLHQGKKTLPHV